MGSILVKKNETRDLFNNPKIIHETSINVEVEEDDDQTFLYRFMYCAAAMKTYPFEVPYSSDDLNDFCVSNRPNCASCNFKDTARWDWNTDKNQTIDVEAFNHPTSIYKKLNKNGSLSHTTYLEMMEYSQEEDFSAPFESGMFSVCKCGSSFKNLNLSPSLEMLREEEKELGDNGQSYIIFTSDKQKFIGFISEKQKEKYVKRLDDCLSLKTVDAVIEQLWYLSTNHGMWEMYRRLLTSKVKKHFATIKVPKRHKYKNLWNEYFGGN